MAGWLVGWLVVSQWFRAAPTPGCGASRRCSLQSQGTTHVDILIVRRASSGASRGGIPLLRARSPRTERPRTSSGGASHSGAFPDQGHKGIRDFGNCVFPCRHRSLTRRCRREVLIVAAGGGREGLGRPSQSAERLREMDRPADLRAGAQVCRCDAEDPSASGLRPVHPANSVRTRILMPDPVILPSTR